MASSRCCSWFATVLVLLAVVTAKEIVPTKEWQRLAENETIPAGMHVRMDLTTGEKWVKLMDEEEEKETASNGHKSTTSQELAVTIAPDGSIQDMDENNSNSNSNSNSNQDKRNNKTTHTPKYDFDMMYRTLAKLPPDALAAMGGLPAPSPNRTSPERSAFEAHLLTIWEARQAELLDLELNLPDVLKARIASLEEYLAQPRKALKQIKLKNNNKTTKETTTGSSTTAGLVTNIVEVLQDLEVQVADIDMARDFHTLGGWPVLVRVLRLSTDTLLNVTAVATDAEASKQYRRNTKLVTRLRLVQTQAAWVLGTAVKNIDEFFPYGIEPILVATKGVVGDGDEAATTTTTTTALDVLIDLFCKKYDEEGVTDQVEYEADEREEEVTQNTAQSVHEVLALRTKLVYGMGAILRGNHAAQTHMAQNGQFERLTGMYQHLLSEPREGLLVAAAPSGEETTVHATALHRKLIQRVTALVIDLVEERVALQLDPATRTRSTNDDDAAPVDADAMVVTFSAAFCAATCEYYLAAIGAASYVAVMTTGIANDPATTAMAGISVPLQATFVRGLGVMGHACPATACTGGSGPGLPALVEIIQADWSERHATFDDEQYHDLQTSLAAALQSLQQQTNTEAVAAAASAATTTAATA